MQQRGGNCGGSNLKLEGEEEKWSKKRVGEEILNVSTWWRHHWKGLIETIQMIYLMNKIGEQMTKKQGKRE